jgi:serine/threonine-protein kinase RsbW
MPSAGDSTMPEQAAGDPVGLSAAGAEAMSYARAADLTAVRDFVYSRACALGLPPPRADLLTLAVSELATNTLQHTTGGGSVRVRAAQGWLVCDVVDRGATRTFGREMPPADAVRGRGLAIVERICDEVTVAASTEGTRVRLRMRL